MDSSTLNADRIAATQAFWKALEGGSLYSLEKALSYPKAAPCLRSCIGDVPDAHDHFSVPINEMATPLHAAFVVSKKWTYSPNHPDFKALIKHLLDAKAPLSDMVEGKTVLVRASEIDPDMLNYGLFARLVRRTPPELLGCKNENGKSALELLIAARAWQRVRIVIERGAPVDGVGASGENALFTLAAAMPNQHRDKRYVLLGLMALLVDKGLSINSRNSKGETVLHAFPRLWNGKDLLRLGADVNAVDNEGVPLLTSALEKEGFALAAELLLHPDLDLTLDGPSGAQTARLRAAILSALPDYPQPAPLLDLGVRLGLDINAVGEDGIPLITQALQERRLVLVQMLQDRPDLDLAMDGPEGPLFAELSHAFSALPGAVQPRDREAAQACLSKFQEGVIASAIAPVPSVRSRM